jgi:STE24 endopeptidase
VEPIFTATELAEVKTYHAPKYAYSMLNTILGPLVLLLMLRFVVRPLWSLSNRLGSAFETGAAARVGLQRLAAAAETLWRGPGWASALVFSLLFFELYGLVDVPVEIWFGYVHEHAHGLARMAFGTFLLDMLKGHLVFVVALGALVFGLFGLARRTPHWWWLLGVAAAMLMVVSTALDPFRNRLYVEQTSLEPGELRKRIVALLNKAGVEFRDVVIEHTASRTVRVQAYFAGTGVTRTIVLNDSLIATFSTDEILASVAHEAGHVNESRVLSRLGSSCVLLVFLWAIERLFRWSATHRWFGIQNRADVRTLPLIVLFFATGLLVGNPVSGAFSRQRELAADQYGIRLTGDAPAFRSMLRKAARVNKMDPDPPRWVVIKGISHPPIAQRIALAQ